MGSLWKFGLRLTLLDGVFPLFSVLAHLPLPPLEDVGRGESFRVELDGGQPLPPPWLALFAEGVQVPHPRFHEPEEADPLVLAALVETQQHKVVAQAPLRDAPLGVLPVAGERLD